MREKSERKGDGRGVSREKETTLPLQSWPTLQQAHKTRFVPKPIAPNNEPQGTFEKRAHWSGADYIKSQEPKRCLQIGKKYQVP